MALRPKIIVAASAEADLMKVSEFLEEQWSPEMAIRFVNRYYQKLDLIESMPGVGFLSKRLLKSGRLKLISTTSSATR